MPYKQKTEADSVPYKNGYAIVTDVVCFLDKLTIDLFALFHNVGGIFPAVLLCQNLFHRAFEHPEIKTVVFHITFPPVIYLQAYS